MLLLRALLGLSQLAIGTFAVQANLAGVVDWHRPLVGQPTGAPGRPIHPPFHTFKAADGSERLSILTLSQNNVIASINAEDGSIDWRHQFALSKELVHSKYVAGNTVVLITSTASGAVVRRIDGVTGAFFWEATLPSPSGGNNAHLTAHALFVKEDGLDVLYVLSPGGERITRLGLSDGALLSSWTSDEDNLLLHTLLQTPSGVAALGYQNGFAGSQLALHPLDPATSSLSSTAARVIQTTSNEDVEPLFTTPEAIVWLEDDGNIYVKSLADDERAVVQQTKAERRYDQLLMVGLEEEGIFVAVYGDAGVDRYDILTLTDGRLTVTGQIEESTDETKPFVRPLKTGSAVDSWSFDSTQKAIRSLNVHLYDKHSGAADWYSIPYDHARYGYAFDAMSIINSAGELVTLVSSRKSGTDFLYKGQQLIWTREEGLASIKSLAFIDLPEAAAFKDEALVSESSVTRHLAQLKHIPDYIVRFASQFLTSTTAVIAPHALHNDDLHRDAFGLRKIVVAANQNGAVFGLDSLDGSILWTYVWDAFGARQDQQIEVVGLWMLKAATHAEAPVVALLVNALTESGELHTAGIELDGLTGKPLGAASVLFNGLPRGVFLAEPATEALDQTLRLMDANGAAVYWPEEASEAAKTAIVSTVTSLVEPFKLRGHGKRAGGEGDLPLWQVSLREGEQLSKMTTVTSGPVASLGKVTGDREVMYKYLNPHLIAYSTILRASKSASIYVVDTSRGSIVYETTHQDVNTKAPIEVLLVENWLVYTFKGSVGDLPCAQQLVSLEMYEANVDKPKIRSPELTTASADHAVKTFSRTFLLATGVRALGVTETRHGITAKDLIIANDANQIVTIPRRGLDPRRPVGPPSAADKQEGLIPYEPYMPIDPKRVVSHGNEVLGISKIHSSPALLESTSIILATGLDLFQTRIMPSGGFDVLPDSFNKPQLVFTILGLAAGIAFTRPIVAARKLKARWY